MNYNMISNIVKTKDCCGCAACMQICRRQCISMIEDEEGFSYPIIDNTKCIECGLCEKVCPVINKGEPAEPLAIYAAKHRDNEVRTNSSSGGVFNALAVKVIKDFHGVVFGCKYDSDWNAIHDYTETIEGIKAFQTSKYVQSSIGNCYSKAEDFLKQGRYVLFSGTPCQIAGLKKFLRKDYDNLLTLDVICHGVPSPGVWREYLREFKEIESAQNETVGKIRFLASPLKFMPVITGINFREKQNGGFNWQKFGFVIHGMSTPKAEQNSVLLSDIYYKNPFMKGFLGNLFLRPSCYACPAKRFSSGSDLSIADFWWIQQVNISFTDDKGVSKCYINTEKGRQYFETLNLSTVRTDSPHDLEEGYEYTGAEVYSAKLTKKRALFFNRWKKDNFEKIVKDLTRPTIKELILDIAKKCLRQSGFLTKIYKKHFKQYIKR